MNFKGTKIAFDFTFFAMLAFLLLWDRDGIAIMSLIACLIHELGHILAMRLFGVSPESVIFYGGGIAIRKNIYILPLYKKLIILSAGCIVNIINSVVFYFISPDFIGFVMVNGVICLFNLLPIGSFDGAEIISAILESLLKPRYAAVTGKIIAVLMTGALFIIVLIYCIYNQRVINISLGIALLYMLIAQIIKAC